MSSIEDRQLRDAVAILLKRERGLRIIGWRYEPETVSLTFRQSVLEWVRGLKQLEWNWSRTGTTLRAVRPDEPGYEDAPYEASVVWQRGF